MSSRERDHSTVDLDDIASTSTVMPLPRTNPGRNASTESTGIAGSVSRFWQRSYAADYVGLVALFMAYILIVATITPFHRMFSLDDISLQYPHATVERVSVFFNIAYSIALPLGLIIIWSLFARPPMHKIHVTILGLLISVVLATFLTDVVKNTVGRPRPDLIARCKPKSSTPTHQLVTIDVCTEMGHHVLHDGWRSFPSGHSSLAFSGLGFLAFFLAGQLHVFRPRTDLGRVLVALAPIIGAALIAISRLEDYRHDVYDVTTGSVLGISVAFFSYTRYYPALKSTECDVPFPSRAEYDTARRKAKDEEAGPVRTRSWSADGVDENYERLPLRENVRSS